MARMIPPTIDQRAAAPGEVIVFDLLRGAAGTETWTVLHSLDLPRHVRQVEGELDFLVLIPGGAAVCIEVKSHLRVARDSEGRWRLGGDPSQARSPFRQASEAMHSVRERLKRQVELAGVPFVSAVVFPRCEFDVDAVEWEPWQVIDERLLRLRGLPAALLNVANQSRAKLAASATAAWFDPASPAPTEDQCARIAALLRPSFEQARSPKARRASRVEELARFTQEQFGALDDLEMNKRIVFTGAAGTGKTFVAMEAARRAANDGARVLLCCFNRLLGDWLKAQEVAGNPLVEACTMSSLMLRIAGLQPPAGPDDAFWDALPSAALDRLLESEEWHGRFDLLVVDEAQDILTDGVIDILDFIVEGGLSEGSYCMFGDFEGQAIYTGCDGRKLLAARSQAAHFTFRENCRNRPAIGRLAALTSGLEEPYRVFRRPDDGVKADLVRYADPAEQEARLVQAVDRLRREGHQLGDIVILSAKADGAASRVGPPLSGLLAPASAMPLAKIRTGTVHAFKGLDAPAVVVTDVECIDKTYDRQILYIACSRATDHLVVLVDKRIAADLHALLMNGDAGHG